MVIFKYFFQLKIINYKHLKINSFVILVASKFLTFFKKKKLFSSKVDAIIIFRKLLSKKKKYLRVYLIQKGYILYHQFNFVIKGYFVKNNVIIILSFQITISLILPHLCAIHSKWNEKNFMIYLQQIFLLYIPAFSMDTICEQFSYLMSRKCSLISGAQ